MDEVNQPAQLARLVIDVRGAVQGVGFRPAVYNLANELGLRGTVQNNPQGVAIEVEGVEATVEAFLVGLEAEKPKHAIILSVEPRWLSPVGYPEFTILPSATGGVQTALVLPDLVTCPQCRAELFDPADRRYRYPFLNCTHCGPRFTIIKKMPYDRATTAMAPFVMCPECLAEYEDPTNRRFHAQPTACPVCGPRVRLWDPDGRVLGEADTAVQAAVTAILRGEVVAVKGLGGFQLLADARSDEAVLRLRQRKHRDEKPFAVMVPNIAGAEQLCKVSALEARVLQGSEGPIVLMERCGDTAVSNLVAPGSSRLGVMLPTTPLHHLLLSGAGIPLIATSGNISDEPICIDEREALWRLHGVADLFLVHDRPILRYIDDSVVQVVLGREMVIRRARGYAPLPLPLPTNAAPILAVGAHLKNTVTITAANLAFVSQHIGDLETRAALDAFCKVTDDMRELFNGRPEAVACDLHPDYISTRSAEGLGLPVVRVQHHRAHVLACMAENGVKDDVLGVSWDGTGYGDDGEIWGGEFFLGSDYHMQRVAHFRSFALPGGDAAVRMPARTALGMMFEVFGDDALAQHDLPPLHWFAKHQLTLVHAALTRSINCPRTTSAGRLFDAVASIIGIRQQVSYEAQAAVELENCCNDGVPEDGYLMPLRRGGPPYVIDWEPMLRALLMDYRAAVPPSTIAARFHRGMTDAIVQVARVVGTKKVVLSGGCFINRKLLTLAVVRLRNEGFEVFWPQRVPPGDGGISYGQAVAAAQQRSKVNVPGNTR